ncbi:MAG: hypothetical protein HY899_16575 [Deltaproteobacteria bacterium]|nr:hypothetical protein [Deltaproteobacteria bacterium]
MRIDSRIVAVVAFAVLSAACDKPQGAPAPAAKPAAPAASAPAAAAPAGGARTVAFELTDAITVGALQIEVEYKGSGRLVGDADGVACETMIEGALSSYNHLSADKTLKAAYVAVKGFTGPARFAQCKYDGTATPADFKVLVKDASTPDLTEVTPAPVIKVVVE